MMRTIHGGAIALLALLTALKPGAAQAQAQAEPQGRSVSAQGVQLDLGRIAGDPAYAAEMVAQADALLRRGGATSEDEAMAHALRAAALATLERLDESDTALSEALRRAPAQPLTYWLAYAAAARLPEHEGLYDLLILSARRFPAERRPLLHRLFSHDAILWMTGRLRRAGDEERLARAAEALVAIGWPGPADVIAGDIFRSAVVDNHLDSGDRDAAARVAATITGPEATQFLVARHRYENLTPAWSRPSEALAEAFARHDAETLAALAAEPDNGRYLLLRTRLLRALGREAEVAALLAPAAAAAETTYSSQPQGRVILEEAAQAMLALGRSEDALALSRRIVAAERAADRGGSAAAVRHAWLLWQVGRMDESIAEAERLLRERDSDLTDYSRAFVRSNLVCALHGAGRGAESAAQLAASMEGEPSAATTRALLCANRLDEAEAVLIRRLEAEDMSALLALQDYREGGAAFGRSAMLFERLRVLRGRPAVAAALERVGRIVQVPAAQISQEVF